MMGRLLILGALILCINAGLAQAQLIVGNDQSGTATIYDVNPSTGVATPIYSSSGTDAKPWGMAYDPSSNTLWWNSGGTLFSSPFGPALTPTNHGQLTFNGAATNYVGLGWSGGKLYGTRNIATEAVYEINTSDLTATQVFVYSTSFDFGGLDGDQTSGRLYGLSDTAPAGSVRGLYNIDIAGQSTTFAAPYPGTETDIDGLAMNAGLAYYVTDGPNTTQPFFYIFDASTGLQVGTIPSPFTGSGTFSAGTWVPEPASLSLLALAAGLALRRR